jgi:DNA-binding FrmR family transcriptional regulator
MDIHTKKQMLDRLSRAEGQIRALKRALNSEEKQDCKHFIAQVKAVRNALKRVSEQYVLAHIHACQALSEDDRRKQIDEAIQVLASD